MVLKAIKIKDFLSVRGTITVVLDRQVTILLGANDHGKSNILSAIEHLNDGAVIKEDEVNWDAADAGDEPLLEYRFELSDTEAQELRFLIADSVSSAPAPDWEIAGKLADVDESTDDTPITTFQDFVRIVEAELPILSFVRSGVDQSIAVGNIELSGLPSTLSGWLDKRPRVELFKAESGEIQDSVTSSEIATDDYEFLQGIFYYAGLNPLDCSRLFTQTDGTERALDQSSKILDLELRRLWAQGTELGLHFELRHRGDAIQFLANDPSVQARKTRMSKRSTGVTQFFRISMVLHARRKKHPANSYIYLFDEPGIFLHPQGQKDLIQVFERLSTESQVAYTTHSLFMLNQNFPERHRLVVRTHVGTKLDQKPYRANWKLATDALGVYLTSNILFSSRVLLVEGDSDPIHIYELFRQFNHAQTLDADANALGIFSFSDLPNLRFLLQVFRRDNAAAKVVVLVDGDVQGSNMIEHVRKLCDRLNVPVMDLLKDHSIEDYVLSQALFADSVITTIRFALEAEQLPIHPDMDNEIRASWSEHCKKPKDNTGHWFNEISIKYLSDKASKVALARNYAFACREDFAFTPDPDRATKSLGLCKDIVAALDIPNLRALTIIESELAETP